MASPKPAADGMKVEQLPIARVLAYAGNAKLGAEVYDAAQVHAHLCRDWAGNSILEIATGYHSCVDHRMVVGAESDEVFQRIVSSLGLRGDVMGVNYFAKPANATAMTVALPRCLSTIGRWLFFPCFPDLATARFFAACWRACRSDLRLVGRGFKYLPADIATDLDARPVGVIKASGQRAAKIVAASMAAKLAPLHGFCGAFEAFTAMLAGRLYSLLPNVPSAVVAGDKSPDRLGSASALA